MSDAFWTQFFVFLAVASPLIVGVLNRRSDAKAAERSRLAAEKVEAVRLTLVHTNEARAMEMKDLAKVAKDTHTLVNNNYGIQLKVGAVALRRVANYALTNNDPNAQEDIAAAELAEKAYKDHMSKQAVVDGG